MKNIKEHIKNRQFSQIYLLHGSENYLKKLYVDKLKNALIDKEDTMNYSYYEGKGIQVSDIIEVSETLPFFSERRVLVIENSGFFKTQSDLADYVKKIPETSCLLFLETEIDKRNRLYKTVKEIGTISEMNGMDEKNIKLWIASILQKDHKKITEDTVLYLLNKTGMDMENISNELEKLICYVYDRDVITIKDIDEISTTQISSKIFLMIDYIAGKKQDEALELYYDLLALKEKPMTILYLITRHYNHLIQVKALYELGHNHINISQKTGLPSFAIGKYIGQGHNLTISKLKDVVQMCIDMEEQVKTGRMNEKIGLELLIVKFSGN